MTKGATGSRRLSVDDWIDAGFTLLADAGIEALKLDRLCGHLGVTKGSFYWHFADMPAYRKALIESWTRLKDDELREIEELGELIDSREADEAAAREQQHTPDQQGETRKKKQNHRH